MVLLGAIREHSRVEMGREHVIHVGGECRLMRRAYMKPLADVRVHMSAATLFLDVQATLASAPQRWIRVLNSSSMIGLLGSCLRAGHSQWCNLAASERGR